MVQTRELKLRYRLDSNKARPLYLQLRDQIIGDIRRGAYPLGVAIPSISALEMGTNASRVTVLRALRELTDGGFIFPQHGKGYYVAERGQTALVGVVAPMNLRTMHYSSQLVAGAELASLGIAFDVLEMPCGTSEPEFEGAVREAVLRGARWLVVVPPDKASESTEMFLEKFRGIERMVIADRGTSERWPSLRQDRRAGYGLLAGHLVEIGAKQVATIGFEKNRHAEAGYPVLQDAFSAAGLELQGHDYLRISDAKNIGAVDAVCCADDYIAAAVYLNFRDKAGRLPFALTGYNHTSHRLVVPEGLTTIDPGLLEMGRRAGEMLGQDACWKEIPTETLIEPRLILGGSTLNYQK